MEDVWVVRGVCVWVQAGGYKSPDKGQLCLECSEVFNQPDIS